MKFDTTNTAQKLVRAERRVKDLKQECIRLNNLISQLEEALAGPERIALDTKMVGGFVGGLHTTISDDEVVAQAIRAIHDGRKWWRLARTLPTISQVRC